MRKKEKQKRSSVFLTQKIGVTPSVTVAAMGDTKPSDATVTALAVRADQGVCSAGSGGEFNLPTTSRGR